MKKMKAFLLLTVLFTGCTRSRDRVLCVGFDASATAWRGGNPYEAGWAQILATSQGGDHIYAALINEKGLANGTPSIDFKIRRYSFLTDKRREYDEAVKVKLDNQRQLLDAALKKSVPAKNTEIIGFLHAAAQIFRAYPGNAVKELVVFTDGVQESGTVNLAKAQITDQEIAKIIDEDRRGGRLPNLKGVAIWFVTGPSLLTAQIGSNKLVRLEVFWTKYVQACGGELRAYSPVLVNFGGQQ